MVGEFPELQGIMGGYYARPTARSRRVARAIEQHYWPRFAGDKLPGGDASVAVALADKLETLAGMFGIGQLPTGDKDPFALRRHALGVVRILVEGDLDLPLRCARQRSRSTSFRAGMVRAGERGRSTRSSTSACGATCASRDTRPTKSRRCSA